MTRNYPHYDIDLFSSGSGWLGTYAVIVDKAVKHLTQEGPWSPAEVTLYDGTVLAGTLDAWNGSDTFTITEPNELPRIIEVDDVRRLRA